MRLIFIKVLLLVCVLSVRAQDVPLLSQKLTDAFMYNPSFAGADNGSVTFTHRTAFNQVEGGGKVNYLSFDMPLSYKNFGTGLSVYREEINFLANTYISAAFAYHVPIGNEQLLSMGVAAEYNNIRADIDQVIGDLSDEMLTLVKTGGYDKMDYSAGLNYHHRYFEIGLSTNRLATAFEGDDKENILTQYYTALGRFMLPVRRGEDLVEPMFIYRKFSRVSHSWDIGCYYTFKELILFGASARFGGSSVFSTAGDNGIERLNITCGFILINKLLLGYSLDVASKNTAGLGPSHEFTLSYEFLENKQRLNGRSPSNYKGHIKRKRNQRK